MQKFYDVKLFVFTHGVKFSGAKLSWYQNGQSQIARCQIVRCQIAWCQIVPVSNYLTIHAVAILEIISKIIHLRLLDAELSKAAEKNGDDPGEHVPSARPHV